LSSRDDFQQISFNCSVVRNGLRFALDLNQSDFAANHLILKTERAEATPFSSAQCAPRARSSGDGYSMKRLIEMLAAIKNSFYPRPQLIHRPWLSTLPPALIPIATFGTTASSSRFYTQPVPGPTALTLLGKGLVGSGVFLRRRLQLMKRAS
jgi:hypothetical protein